MVTGPPPGIASRAFRARFRRSCSICVRSARTRPRPPPGPDLDLHVLADHPSGASGRAARPRRSGRGGAAPAFEPRLKARSWRVRAAARSAAWSAGTRRAPAGWPGPRARRASSTWPVITKSRLLKSCTIPPVRRPSDSSLSEVEGPAAGVRGTRAITWRRSRRTRATRASWPGLAPAGRQTSAWQPGQPASGEACSTGIARSPAAPSAGRSPRRDPPPSRSARRSRGRRRSGQRSSRARATGPARDGPVPQPLEVRGRCRRRIVGIAESRRGAGRASSAGRSRRASTRARAFERRVVCPSRAPGPQGEAAGIAHYPGRGLVSGSGCGIGVPSSLAEATIPSRIRRIPPCLPPLVRVRAHQEQALIRKPAQKDA